MITRRIFTSPTITQRLRESDIGKVLMGFSALFALMAAAELLCDLLGVPANFK